MYSVLLFLILTRLTPGFQIMNEIIKILETLTGSKPIIVMNGTYLAKSGFKNIELDKNVSNYLTQSQIIALLLHEIGHIKKRHLLKMTIFHIFSLASLIWLCYINVWIMFSALIVYNLIYRIINIHLEIKADKYALELGYGHEILEVLSTINTTKLSERTKKIRYNKIYKELFSKN